MYSKATTIAIRARSAKLVVLGLHKRVVTLHNGSYDEQYQHF
jgi:hypothetical protein